MEQIVRIIFSTDFIFSIVRLSTPILLATMAVLISDRAGVINIGVEGTMLFAALMGVIGSAYSGNVWIGLLVAVLSGILFSGIIAFFHLKLETDIVLTGIALNLMASGLTIFILFLLTGDKGVSTGLNSKTIPNIHIPVIKSIPVLGEMLSGHSVLTYLAFIIIAVIAVFLKRTRLGTYIRAAGENADSIETAGISVKVVRLKALLISGAIAGFGGAFMSMSYVSMFTKDMIAGRGFIAMAAEAMGQGKPVLSMLSALFFGATDALSNNLQLFNFPSELTRLIPYALTIIALAFYAARIKRQLKK
ncbi:MAG: ABC transporter permease [Anaerolineaceae bacterium]|nr:MAG: ABC transporter permease [Anaerolineaceae bacterium]